MPKRVQEEAEALIFCGTAILAVRKRRQSVRPTKAKQQINNIATNAGASRAAIEVKVEAANSMVAKIGLPRPPVAAVEPVRPTTVAVWTAAAAPPPAIAAKVHLSSGLLPVNTAAVITVPAMIAAGVAMVSNRWSTQGI